MPVPVPPDELLSEFEDRIRPLLKRIQLSFFAQRNLRQTRDLLIPKLMSGEISVEEVDSEAVTQRV